LVNGTAGTPQRLPYQAQEILTVIFRSDRLSAGEWRTNNALEPLLFERSTLAGRWSTPSKPIKKSPVRD
jgi:hypothetical protein